MQYGKSKGFKILDLILLLITLDGIAFPTPLGSLSISLIGSTIFILFLVKETNFNFKKIYNFPLFLIVIWFSSISTFIGSSIVGNLFNITISVTAALLISQSSIKVENLSSAIKKVIIFHSILLIFDFFFQTPWGWELGQFKLLSSSSDFWRPSGLFAEPRNYSLAINCLYFMLIILKKSNLRDTILVLTTCAFSTSISGVIMSLSLFLYDIFQKNKQNFLNLFSLKSLNKKLLNLIILISILLLPSALYLLNHEFSERLSRPLGDNSFLGSTAGSYFIMSKTIKESPIFGYGLGSKSTPKYDIENPETYKNIGDLHIQLSQTNSLVSLTSMGGLVALSIYIFYLFFGFGLTLKLLLYLLLLSCHGKVFYSLLFIIPSLNRYLILNNQAKKDF